jgi:hypothetical protein
MTDKLTSLAAGVIVLLLAVIAVGGLLWVAQQIWTAVL